MWLDVYVKKMSESSALTRIYEKKCLGSCLNFGLRVEYNLRLSFKCVIITSIAQKSDTHKNDYMMSV